MPDLPGQSHTSTGPGGWGYDPRMRVSLAVLAVSAVACVTPRSSTHEGATELPFMEDNYSQALSQARARRVPLFVDAWAPW